MGNENKSGLKHEAFPDSNGIDQVAGPSDSLRKILDRLSRGSVSDLSVFRDNLRALVMSGLSRKQEIIDEATSFWHETYGTQDQDIIKQTTQFIQFTLAAGRENAADKLGEDSPLPPIIFRRFASPERRGYNLKNPELVASANGLIFNVLFRPNRSFRNPDDIEKLVTYLEHELDALIEKARSV